MTPKQLKNNEVIICNPVGKYIGNYKCHCNVLSYAKTYREDVESIIGVAQTFSNGTCVAHFIVKLNDGTYVDPTYVNLSGVLDTYHIHISTHDVETFKPNDELVKLQNYIFSLRSWLYRLTHRNTY